MPTRPSWRHVTALFEQALEQPASDRPTWVAQKCAGDAELRREVEKLLTTSGEGVDQLVGPYSLVSEIGRGGMGVVYKAKDPRLDRFVALKFLPADLAADETAKQRLLVEARVASALDHPNICTVHDIGHTRDGRLFFAMAFYEGRSLGERMTAGPLRPEEAIDIAEQVARGLVHAHEMGVIHRDIKPSNVFLPERGEAKILDFGLAKRGLSSLTGPGMRLGTLAYMSPEQARGLELDARTDVWSLGVVLFEMVSGRLPFHGDTEPAFFRALLNDDPDLSGAVWPEPLAGWRPIVRRALEKTPENRYPRMLDLAQDLAALRDEIKRSGRSGAGGAPAARVPTVMLPGSTKHTSPGWQLARSPGFVGRGGELSELRQALDGCFAGRGRVVCITGEPGIGKTSLVEDFLAESAAAGPPCHVGRGRCSERLAGTEAYLPVLEGLESLLQGEGRDDVVLLMKEKAPAWYVEIAPVPAAADASFAEVMADAKMASQERMKRELHAFLQELSRRRPVVLFLDDLHWADLSTVDLLSYIGSRCDRMRLLIVAAYRPSDLLLAKHAFLQVQQELQSRGLCREVPTSLLSEADIAAYLDDELPENDLPSFLPALIHERTEGNPLFMTDLLRDLRDRNVIEQRQGRWVLAQSASEVRRDLPESARAMIERKIARLSDENRALLVAAAVQGYTFDSATLSAATGFEVGDVEERLESLGNLHRFVRVLAEGELPDGTLTQRYRFVHVLYLDALYATLRARQRADLSAAIAEALLAAYGDASPEIASSLAYLFEAARRYEGAADHFLLAAEHAAGLDAGREGLILAQRALICAERLDGNKRLERVLGASHQMGQLHLTLSEHEEAIRDFERAEAAAAELGDVEAQVAAICSAALAHFNLRRTEETRREATRALGVARGYARATAGAEVVLGLERLCLGATDEAEAFFDQAVPVLQREGPPLHALEAIGFASLSHAWQLDYEEAHAGLDWSLQRSRDLGLRYHIIMHLFVRGMAYFNQGRLSQGLADLEEGMRLAEQNDERYWLSRYPNTLGWAYRELQDTGAALRWNVEGAQVAHESGYGKPEANSHLNLAQHHLDVGELNRTFEHLQRAQAIFEEDLWFRWRYYIRLKAELCRYWLRRGDAAQAGLYARESLELAEPRHARKHMAWAHKLLGDVAVLEEKFDEARREYEAALGVLRQHRCPTYEWKILLAAAEMASAYRNVGLAERYRGRCRQVIESLADSITEEKLRRQFLSSEAIRAALI